MTWINELNEDLPPSDIICNIDTQSEYTHDKGPGIPQVPSIVICPTTEDSVQTALKIASRHNIPVTPRGTGTGTTGGAIPLPNGIVLSLENLNRIIEVDTANRSLVAQPGVLTQAIHDAAESYNLFYPPDPASLAICTIGGNVAENAGGPRAVKYGVTGDYVIGLSGFYADGTPFKFGGKQFKNVAGYDLMRLMIGSEGTLGIITRITLKLVPKPTTVRTILAAFDSFDDALSTLEAIHTQSTLPATAEFVDKFCIESSQNYLKKSVPWSGYEAVVIFEVDGPNTDTVDIDVTSLITLCQSNRARHIEQPTEVHDIDLIWEIRRHVSPSLKAISPQKASHDVVVPPSKIGDYMRYLRQLSQKTNSHVVGYGHLGDGNIHVNLLKGSTPDDKWLPLRDTLAADILSMAVSLGGSISGEHGIGQTKKAFMKLMYSDTDMSIMRSIKHAFDPQNILNPDKIL